MQVRLLGVAMQTSDQVPLSALFAALEARNGETIKYWGIERRIYAAMHSGCYVALVLSVRDQRRWMEMHEEKSGRIIIEPHDLDDGQSMVDFNYLAVNAKTGRGLYLHYFNGVSVPSLSNLIMRTYRELLVTARANWIAANGGPTRANTKTANVLFENNFMLAQIVQEKDLPALLKDLDRIRSLQFDFVGVDDKASMFGPLGQHVKMAHYKVTFDPDTKSNAVADQIIGQIKKKKPDSGRVVGTNDDGTRESYELEGQPTTVFGRLDYDQVAEVAIDPENFTGAEQLANMISIIKDVKNRSVFVREAAKVKV